MQVDGIFRIKGRGWVLSCPYTPGLEIGMQILDEQDRLIGKVRGLEYTVGNYGFTGNVGIVIGEANEDLLPFIDDVISIVE